jgi:hypothetical protein
MPDLKDIVSAAQMGHATWKAGYDEAKRELARRVSAISHLDGTAYVNALMPIIRKFITE